MACGLWVSYKGTAEIIHTVGFLRAAWVGPKHPASPPHLARGDQNNLAHGILGSSSLALATVSP